jgi:hypothetical protein
MVYLIISRTTDPHLSDDLPSWWINLIQNFSEPEQVYKHLWQHYSASVTYMNYRQPYSKIEFESKDDMIAFLLEWN